MSHQESQDSHSSYMDGVCVKISEKYKPPPRINLAVSYSQRLMLNQQIRDCLQVYNFSLETNAKQRMQEFKNARKLMLQNKKGKLEKIKAARTKQAEEVAALKDFEANPQCTCEASQIVTTDILYPTYSHILTPTPLVNSTSHNYAGASLSTTGVSPFNIADFEPDTSSPFDNMELKTINDIEELAQVLKKDQVYTSCTPLTTTSTPTNYIATYPPYNSDDATLPVAQPTYSNLNGIYYLPNQNYTNYNYNSLAKPINLDSAKLSSHNNINITKTLRDTHISKQTKPNEVDNTYESLPKNLQQLSHTISSMGFPLSRVAKACQALGDDQKKVVEHLLVMSELLDLGFSESDVSSALLQCNNDRDRALDILIK